MTEAIAANHGVASDMDLIAAVRAGNVAAYGVLYERHLEAARRAAASLVARRVEREDLIAEAFTRVLRILRAGGGPVEGFRPYLLTTMRNAAISAGRRDSGVSLVAEVPDTLAGRADPTSGRLHATVAAAAFAGLPERWRLVLWYTEVAGESSARVAARLGMTPNGAAALAYRARQGLRQAYLSQYLPTVTRSECRAIVAQLAGWIRRGSTGCAQRRITGHLDRCGDCRQVATDLRQINAALPTVIGAVFLAGPAGLSAPTTAVTASEALLIGAAHTTAPWLTTVKTMMAGAALAATTAIGVVASDPVPEAVTGSSTVATPPDPRPAHDPHPPAPPNPDTPTGSATPSLPHLESPHPVSPAAPAPRDPAVEPNIAPPPGAEPLGAVTGPAIKAAATVRDASSGDVLDGAPGGAHDVVGCAVGCQAAR